MGRPPQKGKGGRIIYDGAGAVGQGIGKGRSFVEALALQVKDAVAAANALKAKGAKILLGPVVGPRTTYVFVADNSGIPFELVEFKE